MPRARGCVDVSHSSGERWAGPSPWLLAGMCEEAHERETIKAHGYLLLASMGLQTSASTGLCTGRTHFMMAYPNADVAPFATCTPCEHARRKRAYPAAPQGKQLGVDHRMRFSMPHQRAAAFCVVVSCI